MVRAGLYVTASVLVVAALIGVGSWASAEAAPPAASAAPIGDNVDLTALRDAVAAAAKKGENVDEIQKALEAFEKTAPKGGRVVPAELQALRDAVDAAAKKGENVEAIIKELVVVETAVAGRALTKPKPEPTPPGNPNPNPIGRGPPPPFIAPNVPNFPNPLMPAPGIGIGGVGGVGGIDVESFNKAMELRKKAVELLLKDPNDPATLREAQKLQAEAAELMLKAARVGAGGVAIGMPAAPLEFGRMPDRARLGIRLERVPAVASEQLGLEPNTGIAVTLVVAGSAAEKAGLKVHDIILEFAGKAVTDNTEDFINRVNAAKAGEKIDLVVLRKGKKVEVKGVELPAVGGLPRVPPAPIPNVANPFLKAAEALDPIKPVDPPKLPPVAPVPPLVPATAPAAPKP